MDEREPSGVDRSLIEEYVRLTPRERAERAIAWANLLERIETARETRVGRD